jgi:hypothetical protein
VDGKSTESESTESAGESTGESSQRAESAGKGGWQEDRERLERALRALRAQAKVDGKSTESENIADHGGLKVALQALKVLVLQKYKCLYNEYRRSYWHTRTNKVLVVVVQKYKSRC